MSQPDLEALGRELDDVQHTMLENVSQLTYRGDRLASLHQKTELLAEQSQTYKDNATTLRKRMASRRTAIIALFTFVGIVVLYIFMR